MDRPAKHFYEFGSFRLDAGERLLLRDGEVVPLTPKVFDILLVLVQNSGHILEKDEVLKTVWPDQFVEEGNLARNISTLRKALGESPHEHQYIETIPWRGYRFVASVRELQDQGADLILEKHTRSHIVIQEEEEKEEQEERETPRAVGHLLPAASTSRWLRTGSRLQVLVLSLLLAGLTLAFSYFWISRKRQPASTSATIRSMAVLPFRPLSAADDDDEYLGLGMADTLITRLSGISQIVVRPMSAVRKYTDAGQDPVEAGRELGVDSVLEGNVQKSGDRIRVTVRLVRVGDGQPLWADKFDEDLTDIFKVQDSISEKVAGALMLELTARERRLLTKRYTEDVEAHQLYLKGRYYWNKRSNDGLKRAVEFYRQAIDKDPTYALAYAGLADCYDLLSSYSDLPPREALPKAEAAATRALEIDDSLGEAHTSLAFAKLSYDWDWAGAEREFKRAIELNPNYSTAHHWYAFYLAATGHVDDALAEIKRAQELDPLSLVINSDVGVLLYYARQYDRSIEQHLKTLDMDPNFAYGHAWLRKAYEQKEMYKEANAERLKVATLAGASQQKIAALKDASLISDGKAYWQNRLEHTEGDLRQGPVNPYTTAQIYAMLGEKDRAFGWLEKAYTDRRIDLIWTIRIDPEMDGLRSDPRFTEMLRRVGLAP
jgi:DNA-binding winged helix-turn-helix (wHTH) protein/TolB-like protein/Tfp pilus assembly protein PilF